jgi:hypothetical protein
MLTDFSENITIEYDGIYAETGKTACRYIYQNEIKLTADDMAFNTTP